MDHDGRPPPNFSRPHSRARGLISKRLRFIMPSICTMVNSPYLLHIHSETFQEATIVGIPRGACIEPIIPEVRRRGSRLRSQDVASCGCSTRRVRASGRLEWRWGIVASCFRSMLRICAILRRMGWDRAGPTTLGWDHGVMRARRQRSGARTGGATWTWSAAAAPGCRFGGARRRPGRTFIRTRRAGRSRRGGRQRCVPRATRSWDGR